MKECLVILLVFVVTLVQGEGNSSDTSPSKNITRRVAAEGDFPYFVHMKIHKENMFVGFCGGSIIDVNWILTAAHCVDTTLLRIPVNLLAISIYAGTPNRNGTAEQTVKVVGVGVHNPTIFNPNIGLNDLALLKTDTSLKITELVKPIPLVAADTNVTDYVGQFVTVMGFGSNIYNDSSPNSLLYNKHFKIIPFQDCREQYEKIRLPTTAYCVQAAVSTVSITCSGSSGGPVTLDIGGETKLIGVVSFVSHEKCDDQAQGHTDVGKFVKWIKGVTKLPL